MPVTIKNLTDRPVLLRFTSGASSWVGAGEKLEDVIETEIKDNTRIHKLEQRRIIRVIPQTSSRKSTKKK